MSFSAKDGFVNEVVTAITKVVGVGEASLHEPMFSGNEWQYLKECLDTTYVSSVGKYVDMFEEKLAEYTGANYAVAVVNGTAALHISLLLIGVQKDHEILIPALSFVATANAVSYTGATPHFVDCESNHLGIDTFELRKYLEKISEVKDGVCLNKNSGRIIKAVIPMHVFGHPVNMVELVLIAKDFHLEVIEDAAESLGSTYNGKHAGTLAGIGALSFNGNKIITTGGGGAILFKDRALAIKAKHLTTTAKLPHPWEYRHDCIGYNYRLPNLNAALGCAQLENVEKFINAKRDLHKKYSKAFSNIKGLSLLSEPTGARSNYWLQAIKLDDEFATERDAILNKTNSIGIMTRPVWSLLSNLSPYKDCPKMDLENALDMERRIINIPSSMGLILHG
jgi:aminotransferase in exopolysaccharide biosynthesis